MQFRISQGRTLGFCVLTLSHPVQAYHWQGLRGGAQFTQERRDR